MTDVDSIDRELLDSLLCDSYPDQDGFSVSDVIEFVLPFIEQWREDIRQLRARTTCDHCGMDGSTAQVNAAFESRITAANAGGNAAFGDVLGVSL